MNREKIAHDLTMLYLYNRYGIDINGNLHDGDGYVSTDHFPSTTEARYVKVKTGEKGIFGMEKKQKIQSGYAIDDTFKSIVKDYRQAYEHFYSLLGSS